MRHPVRRAADEVAVNLVEGGRRHGRRAAHGGAAALARGIAAGALGRDRHDLGVAPPKHPLQLAVPGGERLALLVTVAVPVPFTAVASADLTAAASGSNLTLGTLFWRRR
jgi:hypothetical protein